MTTYARAVAPRKTSAQTMKRLFQPVRDRSGSRETLQLVDMLRLGSLGGRATPAPVGANRPCFEIDAKA